MSYQYLLTLLGGALVVLGMTEGGWLFLAVWLGCNFLVLGFAHSRGLHRVFGKRTDGSLPLWSWIVFLPLLSCTTIVWHFMRVFSREPVQNTVTENLVVGRRILGSELEAEFDNFVDLTAEFSEPLAIRRSRSYFCFPILDGAAPMPEELRAAVSALRPGRTFVHCAQGHGRTGLFALAMLLRSGMAVSVEDGLRILTAVRPGIRLSREQLGCIQAFVQDLASQV